MGARTALRLPGVGVGGPGAGETPITCPPRQNDPVLAANARYFFVRAYYYGYRPRIIRQDQHFRVTR